MDPSSSPCLYDLSPRTILRLSGPDRERYLNGQVTQDVRLATADQAVFSCVLDPKGRLAAVCHIREHEDSYLIDAPLDLREDLFARLDRYIIADDVELSDESDDWHLGHLVTRDAPEGNLHWRCTRLGPSGFDLLAREPISLQGVREMSAEHFDWGANRLGNPGLGCGTDPRPPSARCTPGRPRDFLRQRVLPWAGGDLAHEEGRENKSNADSHLGPGRDPSPLHPDP